MTPGERQVWAAVYARGYRALRHPPRALRQPSLDAEWRIWEREQICAAIESARSAVSYMRAAREQVKKGWGADSSTYKMLLDMLQEVDQ